MISVRALRLLASFLTASLFPWSDALGHQAGVSYAELDVDGAEVRGSFRFSLAELTTLVNVPADPRGRFTAEAVAGAIEPLRRATLEAVTVRQGGVPCVLRPGGFGLEEPDGLRLDGTWTCPRPIARAEIELGFLPHLPRGHTHLVKVQAGERLAEHAVRAERPRFWLEGGGGAWSDTARRFLALGVEHIFTGYDHLAFLLGLLLLGGTLRGLFRIVTAFTLAHSLTLALATLGVVTPPASLVEPLIAASVCYVGLENVWAARHAPGDRARALARRWKLTFAFGLVHGFGFAGVLRALRLPRGSLAASLVSFNLGVEAGQLGIVAVAFPLLLLLRRRSTFREWGVLAGSLSIAAVGAWWLLERTALAQR
ncbi:MAG TPA: HupE/UreJ family protein [Anaeromyxobacteraceae bacterium]|nr:HupE/UreJ family protein [Anaeromyxobacteraceae bacterium]